MKILLPVDECVCSQTATQSLLRQMRPLGVEVHVFHAIEWPKLFPESFAFGEGPEFAAEFKQFLDTQRQRARALSDRTVLLLRDAGFQATGIVREAEPKSAILEYADEWQPDLIVMGSHGRKGIDRIVLGSVSEAVARHANCSVQIMRTSPGRAQLKAAAAGA
jgi:nucleotide-binding universal stress UspA family protein